MWYREAVTRVDPSGQINMDFPDIKPKPFNLNNIEFDIEVYNDYLYSIKAKLYGKTLGYIDFEAKDYSDTAFVQLVSLNEYPAY